MDLGLGGSVAAVLLYTEAPLSISSEAADLPDKRLNVSHAVTRFVFTAAESLQ